MKDTLSLIMSSIVENPDDVRIEETQEDGIVSLVVHVNPSDMGRVIGKNGKIIRAIRNVMKIPAIKQNKRVDINISEE